MVKFTVLVENQEACGLEGEHGLSIYIEYERLGRSGCNDSLIHNKKKILLDAGQSSVFLRNAAKLGCDPAAVETAVLSHAHYDHAGGFGAFFKVNQKASVYARAEGKCMDCWSIGEKQRYIGIPEGILQEFPDQFVWVKELTEIAPGVWLVPHSTKGLGEIGVRTGMYRRYPVQGNPDKKYTFLPDDFSHEQSLVLESEQGLVIFNSCSHGGVANIVEEVRQAFLGKTICAYVGGFHLKAPGKQEGMNCSAEDVEQLGNTLLELGIRHIYTGHCTGTQGYEILKGVMGEVLHPLRTGMTVEL